MVLLRLAWGVLAMALRRLARGDVAMALRSLARCALAVALRHLAWGAEGGFGGREDIQRLAGAAAVADVSQAWLAVANGLRIPRPLLQVVGKVGDQRTVVVHPVVPVGAEVWGHGASLTAAVNW